MELSDVLLEFGELCDALSEVLRRMREDAPSYVVRAETDTGTVYLHNDDGGSHCWTSRQKHAHRYGSREEARAHLESAFCPDGVAMWVVRLRTTSVRAVSGGISH